MVQCHTPEDHVYHPGAGVLRPSGGLRQHSAAIPIAAVAFGEEGDACEFSIYPEAGREFTGSSPYDLISILSGCFIIRDVAWSW